MYDSDIYRVYTRRLSYIFLVDTLSSLIASVSIMEPYSRRCVNRYDKLGGLEVAAAILKASILAICMLLPKRWPC